MSPPPPRTDADAKKPLSSLSNSIHDTEGRLRRLVKDDADLQLWLQHTRYFDLGHRKRVLESIRKLKVVEEEREKLMLELRLAQASSSSSPKLPPRLRSTSASVTDEGSVADDDVAVASHSSTTRAAKVATDTRFFLVKCFNTANIYMSQRDGLWVTQTKNGDVFSQAFNDCQSVILFFSINKSRGFQGFARMMSVPDAALPKPDWIQKINLKAATDPFRVEWINTAVTEFDQVGDLKNPLNEFRSVVVGRDGQEYPPECGLKMMALLSQAAIKPSYAAAAAAANNNSAVTIPSRLPLMNSLQNASPSASVAPPSSRPWRASRHRDASPTPLPAASAPSLSVELSSQKSHPNLIDC
ncbi:hypothetical protein L249_8534 [Ophiocordyceps polyrhachis-furcata BCC 54312]|uniref:YTH domain-containing protein n=1 Tax=Ophiocordyceps polyrhachis-furcata BCC 54312 TaxID=1330021 RepID=A0A367L735_9HYPO|nr:hypothetical protein L249_8534 [Ophiocordyceps polyrhachis-furcata BCC 54312]